MHVQKHKNATSGFTLIELLVVMAIIAILASIVLVLTDQVRAKSNDTHRFAELQQLTLALQVYYTDNGRYPSTSGGPTGTYVANIQGLAPRYIEELPTDPTRTGNHRYRYASSDLTKGYTILVNLETDQITWCRLNAGSPGMTSWDNSYPLCN